MLGNCTLVLKMVICQLKIIQIIKNYITVGKNLSSPTKPDQSGICSIFCLEVMTLQKRWLWKFSHWLLFIKGFKGLKSFNVEPNFIELRLKWSNLGL